MPPLPIPTPADQHVMSCYFCGSPRIFPDRVQVEETLQRPSETLAPVPTTEKVPALNNIGMTLLRPRDYPVTEYAAAAFLRRVSANYLLPLQSPSQQRRRAARTNGVSNGESVFANELDSTTLDRSETQYDKVGEEHIEGRSEYALHLKTDLYLEGSRKYVDPSNAYNGEPPRWVNESVLDSIGIIEEHSHNHKAVRKPFIPKRKIHVNAQGSSSTRGGGSDMGSTSTSSKTCGTPHATYWNTSYRWDASHHSTHTGIPQIPQSVSRNLTGKVVKTSAHAVAGGAYSDVWQGAFNGRSVAIKAPRIVNVPATKLAQRLRRELESWARAEHKNILPLLGYCMDFGPVPCFISPWMRYGTVLNFLEEHPYSDRVKLLEGLADGLSYLHQIPIVHGDIRGTNVLVSSDGEPRISDFGLSHRIGHLMPSTTPHGSLRWKAPERHEPAAFGLSTEEAQGVSSDVWSFGMTILELITGNAPYSELQNDHMVILTVLAAKTPARPSSSEVDSRLFHDLWLLCGQCWSFQPQMRPSMKHVYDTLLQLRSRPLPLDVEDNAPSLGILDVSLDFIVAERARASQRAAALRRTRLRRIT